MSKKQGLIARLLGSESNKPPAVSDVQTALDELAERQREIAARRAAIEPSTPRTSAPGPERARVLATGSPAELVALDDELVQLAAERQQLEHRAGLLRKKLEQAQAAEALAALPDLIRSLPKTAKEIEAARLESERAEERFRHTVERVKAARRKAGPDAPGVDQELAGQLADLLGFHETDSTHTHSSSRLALFQTLGAGPTPKSTDTWTASEHRTEARNNGRRPAEFLEKGGALRRADRP